MNLMKKEIFRAVINQADFDQQDKIDKSLIKEIGEVLEAIFKDKK